MAADLRVFVVFEPSYRQGLLILLGSLMRHASQPIAIDVLTRKIFAHRARATIERVLKAYPGRATLNIVIMPDKIVQECVQMKFAAHFAPEIMFRLYYFDIVSPKERYIVYADTDTIWRRDVLTVPAAFSGEALLHVVEDKMPEISRKVMPAHITTYINSGVLVFDAKDREQVRACLAQARALIDSIKSGWYFDQDAINIAFHGKKAFLPKFWNYTLSKLADAPVSDEVAVLHATGSCKPWFFCGGHPYTAAYLEEADHLSLSFVERFDFFWAVKKIIRKAKQIFSGKR